MPTMPVLRRLTTFGNGGRWTPNVERPRSAYTCPLNQLTTQSPAYLDLFTTTHPLFNTRALHLPDSAFA